mmetsp:Transcript_26309/g.86727  ORF Transcript_26309/g.86727 Transcript_26309/m.86727 type:complete len:281 (-) Transcript_26309:91-933(-)
MLTEHIHVVYICHFPLTPPGPAADSPPCYQRPCKLSPRQPGRSGQTSSCRQRSTMFPRSWRPLMVSLRSPIPSAVARFPSVCTWASGRYLSPDGTLRRMRQLRSTPPRLAATARAFARPRALFVRAACCWARRRRLSGAGGRSTRCCARRDCSAARTPLWTARGGSRQRMPSLPARSHQTATREASPPAARASPSPTSAPRRRSAVASPPPPTRGPRRIKSAFSRWRRWWRPRRCSQSFSAPPSPPPHMTTTPAPIRLTRSSRCLPAPASPRASPSPTRR